MARLVRRRPLRRVLMPILVVASAAGTDQAYAAFCSLIVQWS